MKKYIYIIFSFLLISGFSINEATAQRMGHGGGGGRTGGGSHKSGGNHSINGGAQRSGNRPQR